MKLHILSDLHLEFSDFTPPHVESDVVVLAGDIAKKENGIPWARNRFPNQEIVYVPGNHEFYGTQRLNTLSALRLAAREYDVHLLDNDEVILNGVRFLGSTLWTDFRLFGDDLQQRAMAVAWGGINDFKVIHEGLDGHFSPNHSVDLHLLSRAWLEARLAVPFLGKTVVVTHHLPSFRSVVPRFKKDILSACFASSLDNLFGQMDLWIHGHTHDNLDYEMDGTRVLCNPRGYVTGTGIENIHFNPSLVVEV